MEEDQKVPLILGRPFLATSWALTNVQSGEFTLSVEDDKVQLSIYKNEKLQKKESEVCMRIEAIPMQGLEINKKAPEKDLSVISLGEEQRGRKWNSSLIQKWIKLKHN